MTSVHGQGSGYSVFAGLQFQAGPAAKIIHNALLVFPRVIETHLNSSEQRLDVVLEADTEWDAN
jgi:hypothetical protein